VVESPNSGRRENPIRALVIAPDFDWTRLPIEEREGYDDDFQNELKRRDPFRSRVKPVPCDPSVDDASPDACEVFREDTIMKVIVRNKTWLRYKSRSTEEILQALFCNYLLNGLSLEEVHVRISSSMYRAGYIPDAVTNNPCWNNS
jgi:hypothetical protein